MPVEAAVVPGDGVFAGLHVREDRRLRKSAAHGGLDLFAQVVALLDGPRAGHEDVHRNETPRAGRPGLESVDDDTGFLKWGEDLGDRTAVLFGQGGVQQPKTRL